MLIWVIYFDFKVIDDFNFPIIKVAFSLSIDHLSTDIIYVTSWHKSNFSIQFLDRLKSSNKCSSIFP